MIVRVGGGFLDLEEFLEVYGPTELLKVSKKEPQKSPAKRIR